MGKLIKRYFALNIWVKIIFFFCLFGAFVNFFLVWRDIAANGILLRLHAGFLVLYVSQVVFILLHDYYLANPVPSVEAMTVYKYVFVSAAFTLQLLSAYALFSLLPKYEPKKKEASEPEK